MRRKKRHSLGSRSTKKIPVSLADTAPSTPISTSRPSSMLKDHAIADEHDLAVEDSVAIATSLNNLYERLTTSFQKRARKVDFETNDDVKKKILDDLTSKKNEYRNELSYALCRMLKWLEPRANTKIDEIIYAKENGLFVCEENNGPDVKGFADNDLTTASSIVLSLKKKNNDDVRKKIDEMQKKTDEMRIYPTDFYEVKRSIVNARPYTFTESFKEYANQRANIVLKFPSISSWRSRYAQENKTNNLLIQWKDFAKKYLGIDEKVQFENDDGFKRIVALDSIYEKMRGPKGSFSCWVSDALTGELVGEMKLSCGFMLLYFASLKKFPKSGVYDMARTRCKICRSYHAFDLFQKADETLKQVIATQHALSPKTIPSYESFFTKQFEMVGTTAGIRVVMTFCKTYATGFKKFFAYATATETKRQELMATIDEKEDAYSRLARSFDIRALLKDEKTLKKYHETTSKPTFERSHTAPSILPSDNVSDVSNTAFGSRAGTSANLIANVERREHGGDASKDEDEKSDVEDDVDDSNVILGNKIVSIIRRAETPQSINKRMGSSFVMTPIHVKRQRRRILLLQNQEDALSIETVEQRERELMTVKKKLPFLSDKKKDPDNNGNKNTSINERIDDHLRPQCITCSSRDPSLVIGTHDDGDVKHFCSTACFILYSIQSSFIK